MPTNKARQGEKMTESKIITNKEKRRSYEKIAEQRIGETRLNNLGSKV
jgi:hypothetical protein